jgi:hypothetical protein
MTLMSLQIVAALWLALFFASAAWVGWQMRRHR